MASEDRWPLYWLNLTTCVNETGRQKTTSWTKGVWVLFGSAISIIATVLPRANTLDEFPMDSDDIAGFLSM